MRTPLVPLATAATLLTLALAPPALALGEVSATASYTCTTSSGVVHPAVRYSVGAPPATVVAGQTVRLPTAATLALDAPSTGLVLAEPGATSVGGSVTTSPTGTTLGLDLALASTTLGNGAAGVTNASLSGSAILRATVAGVDVLRVGDLGDVVLTGLDADGASLGTVEFPTPNTLGACTDDGGGHDLVGTGAVAATVVVVKDTSATSVTATHSSARRLAVGTARVRSHFGLRATGSVAFTLRRGSHAVATVRSVVDRRGVARARFPHVTRPGRYAVVGRYSGDAALHGSRGVARFRIGA